MQDKIQEVFSQLEQLQAYRSPYNRDFQDITDYIVPRRGDFNRSNMVHGSRRQSRTVLFDSTPCHALEELASALQGYMMSPSERWFEIVPQDETILKTSFEARAWCQYVADLFYARFSNPASYFYPASYELSLDMGAYGTGIMLPKEIMGTGIIRYNCIPLNECFLGANDDMIIDRNFRIFEYTPSQILDRFGKTMPQDKVEDMVKRMESNSNSMIQILHAVGERKNYNPSSLHKLDKRFYSLYITVSDKILLDEGGFDEFPYLCPRWYTLGSEVYGKGPGSTALPDIKTLNQMEKTNLKAAQKVADPPTMMPDDGFLSPLDGRPGAINYYRAGMGASQDKIEPIFPNINMPVALEVQNQKREAIRRMFYNDLLQEIKNVEMTATEASIREEARMRILAPQLSRLASEYLNPNAVKMFNMLKSLGEIPDPPRELEGEELTVKYISPMARAQRINQAAQITRAIDQITPLAQIDPTVLDALNKDRFTQFIFGLYNTPTEVLNTPEEIDALRQTRMEQQQQEQQMQEIEQGSKALGNVAKLMPKTAA